MRNIAAAVSVALATTGPLGISRGAAAERSRAQPTAEPSPDAVQAFYRGRDLFGAGRYEEALHAFEEADRLHPSADLQFNIGQCHMRLADWHSAITAFEVYLHLKPDASDRGHVESLIEEARTNLEKEVDEGSSGIAATSPAPHPVPGASRTTRADRGDEPEGARMDTPVDEEEQSSAVLVGTGAGVLAVGLGTLGAGIGLSVLTRERNESIRRINEGNPDAFSFREAAELEREADRYGTGQYVAYALGGALTLSGVVLLAVGLQRTLGSEQLRFTVGPRPDGGSVWVEGRF